MPLQQWFKRDVSGFFRELLMDRRHRQREYFEARGLRAFLSADGTSARPMELWMLRVLELWRRTVLEGGAR